MTKRSSVDAIDEDIVKEAIGDYLFPGSTESIRALRTWLDLSDRKRSLFVSHLLMAQTADGAVASALVGALVEHEYPFKRRPELFERFRSCLPNSFVVQLSRDEDIRRALSNRSSQARGSRS